jgi:hypothetical protein
MSWRGVQRSTLPPLNGCPIKKKKGVRGHAEIEYPGRADTSDETHCSIPDGFGQNVCSCSSIVCGLLLLNFLMLVFKFELLIWAKCKDPDCLVFTHAPGGRFVFRIAVNKWRALPWMFRLIDSISGPRGESWCWLLCRQNIYQIARKK